MRTCKKQRRYPLKRKPGRTRLNSDEAGATPPFDAPCVTASVRSLPPQSRAARDPFGRVPEPEFRSCKTTSITPRKGESKGKDQSPQPNPLGLLFCNRNGRAYTSQKVVEYQLWPLLDALKIKRAGFHAFRHAHTTLLLEGGASPKVTQRQLRHSDARVTLDIYGHLVEGTHREAVEKLASFLVPTGPNEEELPLRIQ
jgi:hypothetical protein